MMLYGHLLRQERNTVQSIREIAKSIIADMEDTRREFHPDANKHYCRLAIIDYAEAVRRSPERTPEQNVIAFERAYLHAEKAISLGANEEILYDTFSKIRSYWIPRLKGDR